jgi:hypothetical protein
MSNEKKVVITADEETIEELNLEEVATSETVSMLDEEFVEELGPQSVEDLDDAEEIWDNGPTAGMIKAWKALHGDVYVTSLTFEKHVVWRTLSRSEYKQLVKKMEQLVQAGQLSTAEANLWNEEAITEICLLFPDYTKVSMADDMAGIPSLLSQEILEASGFVALEVRQL